MHRRRPWGGPLGPLGTSLIVTLVAAMLWATPGVALAASRSKPKPKPVPAGPDPGWVVEQAEFQSLEQSSQFDLPGTGSYRGSILVRPGSGGGVAAVNQVAIDDYLKGLAEVPATWPAEALKAQAIAARTYALNQLGSSKELCATDACQVYAGLAKEQADATGSWAAAVTATSGQLLLYKNAPILAMYSSSDGGQTVSGSRPYLRAVPDPDDAVSPLSHWRSAVTFGTLSSVFATPGPVIGIAKTDHDTFALTWQAVDGTGLPSQQEVPTHDFMVKLNGSQPAPAGMPLLLPSPRFDLLVDPSTTTVTFVGRGFGHGVGMSQYGAMGKAARGMKAADILAAYYSGIRPVQLPPQSLPAVIPVTVADQAAALLVSAPGRFRVLDGSGNVLAAVASGDWQVTPAAGGKVHVIPPVSQQGPLAVTPVAVVPPPPPDPAVPAPSAAPALAAAAAAPTATAAPVALTFRLSVPALVRITVQPPVGPPVVLAAQPFDAGEGKTSVLIPASPSGGLAEGAWTATIDADAGGGRAAAVPVGFSIGQPAAAPEEQPAVRPADQPASPRLDLAAMAGPRPQTGKPAGWAIVLAALCLIGSIAVVGRGVGREVQARFGPTLR